MAKTLKYPHIVRELRKTKISSKTGIDLHQELMDIEVIRKNLREIGNINPNEVESTFFTEDQPESLRLAKLVKYIQTSLKNGMRGMWLITNSSTKLSIYLAGIAYVWAMTLGKSALVEDAYTITKDIYKGNASFGNDDEPSENSYASMSMLCINSLTPVVAINSQSLSSISLLLSQRVSKFRDSFTVVVSVVDAPFEDMINSDSLDKMVDQVKKQTKGTYGDATSSVLAHSFSTMIFPFERNAKIDEVGICFG